jgi:hypothetical protein
MEDDEIRLPEFIEAVRNEIEQAQRDQNERAVKAGAGEAEQEVLSLQVKEVVLEVEVRADHTGKDNTKIGIAVLSMGGETTRSRGSTQKLTITLVPETPIRLGNGRK